VVGSGGGAVGGMCGSRSSRRGSVVDVLDGVVIVVSVKL
jgi:hypothetical protein